MQLGDPLFASRVQQAKGKDPDSPQSWAVLYPDLLCVLVARTCSGVLGQPLTGIMLFEDRQERLSSQGVTGKGSVALFLFLEGSTGNLKESRHADVLVQEENDGSVWQMASSE